MDENEFNDEILDAARLVAVVKERREDDYDQRRPDSPQDEESGLGKTLRWTGDAIQKADIEHRQEVWGERLSRPKVEMRQNLNEGWWDKDNRKTVLNRWGGKMFASYGRQQNDGTMDLMPEEALHLQESSGLDLTWNGVPMSIQQGYTVLLQGPNHEGCNLQQYLVYSKLVKSGFKVMRHQGDLGITRYEKRIGLDKYQDKRKALKPKPFQGRVLLGNTLTNDHQDDAKDIRSDKSDVKALVDAAKSSDKQASKRERSSSIGSGDDVDAEVQHGTVKRKRKNLDGHNEIDHIMDVCNQSVECEPGKNNGTGTATDNNQEKMDDDQDFSSIIPDGADPSKFCCPVCKISCFSATNILQHFKGRAHVRNLENGSHGKEELENFHKNYEIALPLLEELCQKQVRKKGYKCQHCQLNLNNQSEYQAHLGGKRHAATMRRILDEMRAGGVENKIDDKDATGEASTTDESVSNVEMKLSTNDTPPESKETRSPTNDSKEPEAEDNNKSLAFCTDKGSNEKQAKSPEDDDSQPLVDHKSIIKTHPPGATADASKDFPGNVSMTKKSILKLVPNCYQQSQMQLELSPHCMPYNVVSTSIVWSVELEEHHREAEPQNKSTLKCMNVTREVDEKNNLRCHICQIYFNNMDEAFQHISENNHGNNLSISNSTVIQSSESEANDPEREKLKSSPNTSSCRGFWPAAKVTIQRSDEQTIVTRNFGYHAPLSRLEARPATSGLDSVFSNDFRLRSPKPTQPASVQEKNELKSKEMAKQEQDDNKPDLDEDKELSKISQVDGPVEISPPASSPTDSFSSDGDSTSRSGSSLDDVSMHDELRYLRQGPLASLWQFEEWVGPLISPEMAESLRAIRERIALLPVVHPLNQQYRNQAAQPLKKGRRKNAPNGHDADNPIRPDLQISFDCYREHGFKKSQTRLPDFRVVVTDYRQPPPTSAQLVRLKTNPNDGVPLLFAVVNQGSVSMFALDTIILPEMMDFD